jgi:hypothetical protein
VRGEGGGGVSGEVGGRCQGGIGKTLCAGRREGAGGPPVPLFHCRVPALGLHPIIAAVKGSWHGHEVSCAFVKC